MVRMVQLFNPLNFDLMTTDKIIVTSRSSYFRIKFWSKVFSSNIVLALYSQPFLEHLYYAIRNSYSISFILTRNAEFVQGSRCRDRSTK